MNLISREFCRCGGKFVAVLSERRSKVWPHIPSQAKAEEVGAPDSLMPIVHKRLGSQGEGRLLRITI
jgi:hypothetical protein